MSNMTERYTVGPIVGEGATGVVHQAVLHAPGGLDIDVALKLLKPQDEDLKREARIGGLLRHPHLVDVYEVGTWNDRWFCALEWCNSGTLADHVPLSERAAVDVGLQVSAALAYAHEELELVHLDIKPSNLLVHDGAVKVADLGISNARGFQVHSRIRGTPAFAAPEQRRGLATDVRSDVYALGKTLRALVAQADSDETTDLDSVEPAPAGAALSAALSRIVDRCTAPDPNDRFASMAELHQALRTLEPTGPSLRQSLPEPAPHIPTQAPSLVEPDRFLAGISARLAPGQPVVLVGPPGVGKSTVAGQFAQNWTGKVLRIDLYPRKTHTQILEALGAALARPVHDLEHVLDRLDSTTLVVLDNADPSLSDPWLAPLFEAAPVLLTSRLRGPDLLHHVTVEPLTTEQGFLLLQTHARRRGVQIPPTPAAHELVRRLDGIPLALELAAGRLGVLTVDDILEHLGPRMLRGNRGNKSQSLEEALNWSWEQLPSGHREALRQLCAFSGSFDLHSAQAVLDAPHMEVLDDLIARSMLQRRGSRFILLHTLRDYIELRAGPTTSEIALRHCLYYAELGRPRQGSLVYGASAPFGSERLKPELHNLLRAAETAVRLHRPIEAAHALRGAWSVSRDIGPWSPILGLGEQATQLQLPPEQAHYVHSILGYLALRQGRVVDARRHAEASVDTAQQADQARFVAIALREKGLMHHHLAEMEAAVDCCTRSLAIDLKLGRKSHVASAAMNLANLHINLGENEKAERYFELAFEQLEDLSTPMQRAAMLMNRGNLAQQRGRFAHAHDLYDQAWSIVVDRPGFHRSTVLVNRATLLTLEGRLDEALQSLHDALADLERLGDERWLAYAHGRIGYVALQQGDLGLAEQQLRRGLAGHNQVGNKRIYARVLGELGRVLVRQGRRGAARQGLEEAILLLQPMRAPTEYTLALLWHAEAFPETALHRLEQAREQFPADSIEPAMEWRRVVRALGLGDDWLDPPLVGKSAHEA